ncbi:uncharacterized protein FIBRA_01289 [Fibroporia radiculosa]|uniref:FAD-binding domain-containing protein n=1 Tax=Fibroporia radiculosa TaxID=599839 RepID=J4H108_9APHY|nr:uncharacterized protein FIBRA_01289 [Fibroporia radiculosa]CCL99274.1 predicted protein [Fibroporia radiculosa]
MDAQVIPPPAPRSSPGVKLTFDSQQSTKASLSIDFLIVGGGVAGLTSAIALTRAGHRVLVLEKGDGTSNTGPGGIRIPPNMSKIFFHWGFTEQLRKIASTSLPVIMTKLQTGEILGTQAWSAAMLKDTRGEFMLTTVRANPLTSHAPRLPPLHIDQHDALYNFLHEIAVAKGVRIRYNTAVADIDPDEGAVLLASGEILTADVILGADGERGACRRILFERNERVVSTGAVLYDVRCETSLATRTASKQVLKDVALEKNPIFVSFGNRRAMTGYPVNRGKEMAFHYFVWHQEDPGTHGNYADPPTTELRRVMKQPCGESIWDVAQSAQNVIRVAINQHENLPTWVHDSGRMVVIGQAAHPIAPGTIQGTAMAVEDGAVLAKLFSHLSKREQIGEFLNAFQDLRQARCETCVRSEFNFIYAITQDDGPEVDLRDKTFRDSRNAGMDYLDENGATDESMSREQWHDVVTIFGYDCEDEADNWWMEWGRLRERSQEAVMNGSVPYRGGFSWGTMSIQVNECITSQ